MNPRVRRRLVWIFGICFCAIAFYLASTRKFEVVFAQYVRAFVAALPPHGKHEIDSVLERLPVTEDPSAWVVRKTASVVFFGVIGVVARVLVGRRLGSRAARTALVIGAAVAMSAAIEAFEWPEPMRDFAFDFACGLLGGAIGAIVLRLARRL